jgi:hypothetical protein
MAGRRAGGKMRLLGQRSYLWYFLSWTQKMPFSDIHFMRSAATNFRIPPSRMYSRFSISLMPYFVRYRLSRRRSRSQGNSGQWQQNLPVRLLQMRMWQETMVLDLDCWMSRQPWQEFFCRKKALQTPQFIPQGAMRFCLIGFSILKGPLYY